MSRREFIRLLGGIAVAWPLSAHAQQPAMPVIGFLNGGSPEGYAPWVAAFRRGLKEAGYVEGQNIAIEFRWAEGQYDRLPALAADLVGRQVAVIAATSTPGVLAAKAATTTIPIVFTTSGDPVEMGLVASLSRPGGNTTGATQLNVEVATKQPELLHELVPTATIIALLVNPRSPSAETLSKYLQAATRTFGLQLHVLHASADPFFTSQAAQLGALTLRHAVPAIYQNREFVAAGGLASYGGNQAEPCGRRLHRTDSQGRETGRLAGPADHENGDDNQPQDRQGARRHGTADHANDRRQGD
jgi:putative tryptophan/tyrosine transport system substrate-binding protein